MNLVNEGVLPPDELDDRDERREEQESARRRETVADIVADVRERAENAMRNGERLVHNEAVAMLLRSVADRLEAAWKRDEERAVEHATRHAEAVARDNCRDCVHNPSGKNFEGGNAAAMREALETMRDLAYEVQDMNREGDVKTSMPTAWVIDIVSAALSKPPRNCDVGTAEEQIRRHAECYCCKDACSSISSGRSCFAVWAQMPYGAKGRKGEGENEND